MIKYIRYAAFALLLPAVIAVAEDKRDKAKRNKNEPKVVPGMSIVGNNEAPKSLYIVPWKDVEVEREETPITNIKFSSSIPKEELKPIDKGNFIRELDVYRHGNQN